VVVTQPSPHSPLKMPPSLFVGLQAANYRDDDDLKLGNIRVRLASRCEPLTKYMQLVPHSYRQ
jgi:hypothetical protein